MTSLLGSVLNSLRRLAQRSSQREPTEDAATRLTVGWGMITISCFGVAILGLALGFNGFPLVVAILSGSSILLEGARDLAFEQRMPLARQLRILAVTSLILAGLALMAMILQLIPSL